MRANSTALALAFLALLSTTAWGNVAVKRDPPDIQYKTFDPADPPPEMPRLHRNEAAITSTSFRVQAGANYEPLTRKKGNNGWTTVVAVHGLTINLQLHVVVWLPKGASDKLKAHEEGHRKISERVYQERSLAEARAAGATVDGKRFTGEGDNWRAAAGNAIDPVINDVGKDYLHHTADIADRANEIYDELTVHGTNDKPVDDAIKEAFERAAKENPSDTRPVDTKPVAGK